MVLPLTLDKTTEGDSLIARWINFTCRHVRGEDREDLSQNVHLELLKQFGENYRHEFGNPDLHPDVKAELVRCVDRVRKRLNRARRHKSLDRLAMSGHVVADPKSIKTNGLASRLAAQRDELTGRERVVIDMLRAGYDNREIAATLGMRHTSFSRLKKKIIEKVSILLID